MMYENRFQVNENRLFARVFPMFLFLVVTSSYTLLAVEDM